MDKIQDLLKRPLVVGAVGLVVGIIFGLFVLGYGLFPVKWVDASPDLLEQSYKQDYFCAAVQAYFVSGDANAAKARMEYLGTDSAEMLNNLKSGDCGLELGKVEQIHAVFGVASTGQEQPTGEETASEPEKGKGSTAVIVIAAMCLVTLVIGGALAYIFFFRNKNKGKTPSSPAFQAQMMNQESVHTDFEAEGQEPPIVQFMSTYVSGDDLYDDSFSIDSPSGEFLGECGIGISETIGVGEPKKVTAFEVWLFDKNDIQTVTKVMMSKHAYEDPEIAQRLASKGEPVMVSPGSKIILETATLQLEARVVDMDYGQGALPEGSFFDRLTLELAVWPRSA